MTRAQDVPEYLKALPVKTSIDPALLSELRKGGYLIFFRHAETVMQPSFSGTPEFREDDFTHCETQRNLSKDGRNQAAAIGEAFRALEIPIGFVHASPYCRTRDTAWLAFGRVTPDRNLLLKSSTPDMDREEAQNWLKIRRLAKQLPMAGTNSIFVSHASVIEPFGGSLLAEGEAAIVAPDTGLGAKVIAKIKWDGWIDAN